MEVYWIWLSTLKHVGPVLQKILLNHFHSPKAIFAAAEEDFFAIKGLNKKAVSSIVNSKCLKEAEIIASKLLKEHVGLLHYYDPLYPDSAKICKESPVLLYYKGHLKPFQHAVGVVGSRRCTSYGRKIAEEIGEKLARLHIPVISGFAKGIDSYTHAACVQHGGHPIVFLAGGVDVCYPREQRSLYDKILENGGVILSQYPPGSPHKSKQFLQRNALISAWSTELIVVEASEKSGALWTANFAKNQGRKVYAVPNQIHLPEGMGTNQLIAQGAEVYLGIKSLQSLKGISTDKSRDKESIEDHQPILTALSESPRSIAELSILLKMNEHELMNQLFSLELEGNIIIRGNMVRML